MNKLTIAFLTVATLGLLASINLVIKEIIMGDYCPTIFSIPACYIVLIAFALVIASYFTEENITFWIGSAIGMLLAIYFSYSQIVGVKECPVILIPLCYISLITFIAIIALKIAMFKYK